MTTFKRYSTASPFTVLLHSFLKGYSGKSKTSNIVNDYTLSEWLYTFKFRMTIQNDYTLSNSGEVAVFVCCSKSKKEVLRCLKTNRYWSWSFCVCKRFFGWLVFRVPQDTLIHFQITVPFYNSIWVFEISLSSSQLTEFGWSSTYHLYTDWQMYESNYPWFAYT